MNHKHHHCAHPALKFCSHCNVVYCVDCGHEWYEQRIQYVYQTYSHWDTTQTPCSKPNPEITWTCGASSRDAAQSEVTTGCTHHAHTE